MDIQALNELHRELLRVVRAYEESAPMEKITIGKHTTAYKCSDESLGLVLLPNPIFPEDVEKKPDKSVECEIEEEIEIKPEWMGHIEKGGKWRRTKVSKVENFDKKFKKDVIRRLMALEQDMQEHYKRHNHEIYYR